ncbi:MAG TPA: hypothetical protein VGH58_04110 [Solirubrobacterales bacterium]
MLKLLQRRPLTLLLEALKAAGEQIAALGRPGIASRERIDRGEVDGLSTGSNASARGEVLRRSLPPSHYRPARAR